MSDSNRLHSSNILILGIGNILMGDEGVGVHVIRHLEKYHISDNVECLDGGTGGFHLLGPMQNADKIIIIDATIDDSPLGTIHRLTPKYASDYPNSLTAHDIGLKDLLDSFYLLDKKNPDITLFAVSILPLDELSVELTSEIKSIVPEVAQRILDEINPVLKREYYSQGDKHV